MRNRTDRLKWICPSASVRQARDVLGPDSFTVPLFESATEQGAPSHYLAGIHPNSLTGQQNSTLTRIKGMKKYGAGRSTEDAVSRSGLFFLETPAEEEPPFNLKPTPEPRLLAELPNGLKVREGFESKPNKMI